MFIKLARNIALSVGSSLVGIGVLLVATPIYIKRLGLDQFGLFMLLVSITAPLGILTAGLGQSATRAVASQPGSADTRETLQTVFVLNLGFGILGFAILWATSSWLCQKVFNIPAALMADAITSVRLAGVLWFGVQILETFQAILIGVQDYSTIAWLTIGQQLLTYGGGVMIIAFIPRVPAIMTVAILTVTLISVLAAQRVSRKLRQPVLLPRFHSGRFGQIWRFSSWQVVNVTVSIVNNQIDRIMLGSLAGTSAVGIYGTAANVQTRVVSTVWTGLGALFPLVSSVHATPGAAEDLIERHAWKICFLATLPYLALFALAPWLAPLWLGPEVGTLVSSLLRVLLFIAIIALPSAVVVQYLLGIGAARLLAFSNLSTAIVTVAVTWPMIQAYGIQGAAWGMLAGMIVTRPTFHWWLFRKNAPGTRLVPRCLTALYASVAAGMCACGLAILAEHTVLSGTTRQMPSLASALVLVLVMGTIATSALLTRPSELKEICRTAARIARLDWRKLKATSSTGQ